MRVCLCLKTGEETICQRLPRRFTPSDPAATNPPHQNAPQNPPRNNITATSPPPKKVDAAAAELYQERDWPATLAKGADGLSRLTVEQLKAYLRYHQLPTGGKKAEIVERILGHAAAAEAGGS